MKTAKLIISIISMVLFAIIAFQSCAVGLGNAIDDAIQESQGNEVDGDTSGGGGMIVAIIFLIAGIVGIATRKSKGGGITTGVFFALAALIGFANLGNFGDLVIWSVLALIFAIVFILGSLKMDKTN